MQLPSSHWPGEVPLARLFIGGHWVETAETLESCDPSTGRVIGRACVAGPDEVAQAVAAARAAQPIWAARPWSERRRYLEALRAAILTEQGALTDLLVQEVGKPQAEAVTSDLLPALEMIAYLIHNAGAFLRPQGLSFWEPWFLGKRGWVEPTPLGVIAVITPWNYPFSLTLATVVPALAAGNTVVLKPSELTPLVGAYLGRLFERSGMPAGVVNVVNGAAATGRALVNAAVDKVAFTGSPATARRILADLAVPLRPATLELGGKDPMIVLDDADVEHAARGAVSAAFFNCGQVCASVERVYVLAPVAQAFSARVVALTRQLRVGSGSELGTDVGPLASAEQRQRVHRQVTEAVAAGAQVLCGGAPLTDRPGFFYPPTVLTQVDHTMAVMREETFGPVLPIMVVPDAQTAVRLANDNPLGLSASVWTRDLRRGQELGRQLRAGMVTVNDHYSQYGSPGSPWGGVGQSGYGRVNGPWALAEFTYPKLVVADGLRMRKLWWYPYGKPMLDLFRPVMTARHAGSLPERLTGWARVVPAFLRFLWGRR